MRHPKSPRFPELGLPRRAERFAVLAGTAVAACIVASLAFAGFNSAITSSTMSVSTKRIFPGPRTASAWDLRDASSGAEANKSDPLSYADALVQTSSTAIASGTNRYLACRRKLSKRTAVLAIQTSMRNPNRRSSNPVHWRASIFPAIPGFSPSVARYV